MGKRERNRSVLVRMSEKEHEKFLKKLEQSNLTQQEYLLKAVLDRNINMVDGVRELASELRKIGTNFNQLTKLANSGMIDDCSVDLEGFSKELKELWQSLKTIQSKVH